MSISWIATNPRVNTRNQSLAVPMHDSEFAELMRLIIHDSGDYEQKLEYLIRAKCFLNAEQAAQLVSIFAFPKDKLKAIMILEPKLISMSCQEARSILAALSIPEDRLAALQYVKRALFDANTQEGVDNIVATFTFEEHKIHAARMLQSVINRKGIQIAAGGHQGYAPLGGLYTNASPNNPHIYGHPLQQVSGLPHHKAPNASSTYSSTAQSNNSPIYKSNLPERVNLSTYAKANDYPTVNPYLNSNKLNSTFS